MHCNPTAVNCIKKNNMTYPYDIQNNTIYSA